MAKTTNVVSGNIVGIYRAGVLIGCSTGATFTGTNNQVETTCKDNDGAVTYTPGSQDWQMQFNGNVKFDNIEGFDEILAIWKTKSTATFRFGTSNVDDPFLEGDGFISEFTWEGPLNAPSTWSATILPRGPVYLFNS